MKVRAVILGNDVTEFTVEMAKADDNEINSKLVPSSPFIGKDIYKITATSLDLKEEKYIVAPYLHDHFPSQITNMMYFQTMKFIDLSSLRIVDIDFPEKKFTYNAKTGAIEEIITMEEKKVIAELGGSVSE